MVCPFAFKSMMDSRNLLPFFPAYALKIQKEPGVTGSSTREYFHNKCIFILCKTILEM
jgi:hypothetical protein